MDNKKYSSFEKNQTITKGWRKYLKEEKKNHQADFDEILFEQNKGKMDEGLLGMLSGFGTVMWLLEGLVNNTAATLRWMWKNPGKTAASSQ